MRTDVRTAKRVASASQPISGPHIVLGLGLGGFFDGIVLHQILQWHHILTSGYPPTTVENLKLNTLADGLFHAATYVFVVAGLLWLWRQANQPQRRWDAKGFFGGLLLGWGIFNLVEGLINHQLLGIHHVNETVPQSQWLWWDGGFLVWGAVMLVAGWLMVRASQRRERLIGARLIGFVVRGLPLLLFQLLGLLLPKKQLFLNRHGL